ncbi:MAG TPA: hypothetical protein VGR53_06525 [Nitrososphaerales archaeon]|nr:hypothetical protein [Nitrososphaerales archaeon]
MSERPKRVSKQERYTYSWYQPSQKSDSPNGEIELGSPEGYFGEEPEVADDSSSMLGIESTDQDATAQEDSPSKDSTSARTHGIYRPKHHSLESKSALGGLHFGGKTRIRIGAMSGWSALAGAGATALLTRAGPFPGTQLAELSAVWAGITAFLWIIVAKLAK